MARRTRKVPKPSNRLQRQTRLRRDGWENITTGLGVLGKDKRLGGVVYANLLTQEDAEELWRADDIAARIVETIPNEMLREGFELLIPEQPSDEPKDSEPDDDPDDQADEPDENPPLEDLGGDPEGETQQKSDAFPFKKKEDPTENPSSQPTDPQEDPSGIAAQTLKETPPPPGSKPGEQPKSKPPAGGYVPPFGGKPAQPASNGVIASKVSGKTPGKAPSGDPTDPAEEENSSRELIDAINEDVRRLDAIERLREGLYYARGYGGGGILLGVDDGQDWSKPLDLSKVESLDFLTVLTPRELQPVEWYADMTREKYGEIARYRLIPVDAPPTAVISQFPLIHESRIIRIEGAKTSRRANLRNAMPGWNDSVFVRVQDVIRDFQSSWQGAAIILHDFAPPTLKMKGLAKIVGSARSSDAQMLSTRAAALELARSIARVNIIDADEEYKRETVPVTGLAELLDKLMLRLAAAAGMPVSLLMGQAPAGLNATGDSDIRWFYDQVSALQERTLRPALRKILLTIMSAKKGPCKGKVPEKWDFKFNPLWQLTETEQATLRKIQADVDQIYLTGQVVTPHEIAKSRFGGGTYSTETHIDADLRDELLDDHDLQAEQLGATPDPAEVQKQAAKIGMVPGQPPGAPGAPGAKPNPFAKKIAPENGSPATGGEPGAPAAGDKTAVSMPAKKGFDPNELKKK